MTGNFYPSKNIHRAVEKKSVIPLKNGIQEFGSEQSLHQSSQRFLD